MRVFRIADGRHPLWDGTGSMRVGGRWNSSGFTVIYCATTYAGAMLEVFMHTRIGKIPKSHQCVVAEISEKIYCESVTSRALATGWDQPEAAMAREFGDRWIREQRSAVLLIPSVVTGEEGNVVINPVHPDARKIRVSKPTPVIWDSRLFIKPR